MMNRQTSSPAFRYECDESARIRRDSKGPHRAVSPATSTLSAPCRMYRNSWVPSGCRVPSNDSPAASAQCQSSPPTFNTRAASIRTAELPAAVRQNSLPAPMGCRTTRVRTGFSYRISASPTLRAFAMRQSVAIDGFVRRCSISTSMPLLRPERRAKASRESSRSRRNAAQFVPTEAITALSSSCPRTRCVDRPTAVTAAFRRLGTRQSPLTTQTAICLEEGPIRHESTPPADRSRGLVLAGALL